MQERDGAGSSVRCERCGLAGLLRDADGACPRCGGDLSVSKEVPDAVRRNAVKAVRSALKGLDRPQNRAEAGKHPSH